MLNSYHAAELGSSDPRRGRPAAEAGAAVVAWPQEGGRWKREDRV